MNELFIRQVNIDWGRISKGSYLREISALNKTTSILFDSNITFFVGENGSGKSTLLEGIAVAYGFNAEGGNKSYNFATFDSHSELWDAISIVKGIRKPEGNFFLRAESFYNVATALEDYRDGDSPEIFYERYGGKSFHDQSHGESFLALIQGNFSDNGIYILDEPEAALSPQRQLTLLIEINRLAKRGCQFIIASHSPVLLGSPGACILNFSEGGIQRLEYEDTESYRLTELFVKDRGHFLKMLLEDE